MNRFPWIAGVLLAAGLAGCATFPAPLNEEQAAMRNAREAALACLLFANDNDDVLPVAMSEVAMYAGEGFDLDAFVLVAAGSLQDIRDPGATLLLRARTACSTGRRAVAFVDGHAEMVTEGPPG